MCSICAKFVASFVGMSEWPITTRENPMSSAGNMCISSAGLGAIAIALQLNPSSSAGMGSTTGK